MTVLTSASVVSGRSGVLDAMVGDETVLVGPDGVKYHGLDLVGSKVWQLLDGERSVSDICDVLIEAYDVPTDECSRDVLIFLEDLVDNGLVEVR